MYSKGITWIDDCRIPFVDESDMIKPTIAKRDEFNDYKKTEGRKNIREGGGFIKQSNNAGRFPANILVSDDMLNDGVISKSVQSKRGIYAKGYNPGIDWVRGTDDTNTDRGFNDKGTNSRYYDIDKWFDKILND